MRLLLLALLLYGAYYYGSRRYALHDALTYAQKNPQSKLSAPVEYYFGVIYYQRSDYRKAQKAFTSLLEQHPTDYYVEKALMPLEDCAENDMDWDAAKAASRRYLDDYPSGPYAELARRRLDMLNYRHP
ncbi:MAG: outer membrane protein assembly factor BamD [Elusimicrobia bacterium]|nr:outer membrane protein assembly factor BamD [Elusimicrobiota bacterium]MDE2236935.1 outer membrane protein assembly factor BamD [Elusimicrobiota bacterium]MDE2426498.1 outer membrane protein assembly factor BamD [Elusimicrobiota bacterium]